MPSRAGRDVSKYLKEVQGLPLAIVAIGGLLSKKKNGGLKWKKVHDCLAT
jgi:disease resistance protein RPM1